MYTDQEIKQRLIIIKNSDLDDAKILDENYKQIIKNIPNPEERIQISHLIENVRLRIKELKKESK